MEIMLHQIQQTLQKSIDTKALLCSDAVLLQTIASVTKAMIGCFDEGQKVLFCGNGGSAADAQHLAAEFSGRFYFDRPPLYAEALHVNTSYLTAVGNDYGYEKVFSRLLRGMGKRGDILVGLSTSGNSPNIINAFEVARELGMITVGMTGATGGKLSMLSDFLINVPSADTPRIQECHITVGHIICELVEASIFGQSAH